MIQYIADRDHYTEVLSRCAGVKHDLWIGTADLKDLYVKGGRDVVPFLSVLDKLVKRGVEVRFAACEGAGGELPGGLRQVSWPLVTLGAEAVPPCAF